MNLNTIAHAHQQRWQYVMQSRDALFELANALASTSTVRSLPEQSLRQIWPGVSEGLEDGKIEHHRRSEIWTRALLAKHNGPV